MCKARIIQQHAKALVANRSLPDVLMPVKLRAARSLGIVAVPHFHALQAADRKVDRSLRADQRRDESVRRGNHAGSNIELVAIGLSVPFSGSIRNPFKVLLLRSLP